MKSEWNKRNKEKGHRKTSVNTDVPDRNAFFGRFKQLPNVILCSFRWNLMELAFGH